MTNILDSTWLSIFHHLGFFVLLTNQKVLKFYRNKFVSKILYRRKTASKSKRHFNLRYFTSNRKSKKKIKNRKIWTLNFYLELKSTDGDLLGPLLTTTIAVYIIDQAHGPVNFALSTLIPLLYVYSSAGGMPFVFVSSSLSAPMGSHKLQEEPRNPRGRTKKK